MGSIGQGLRNGTFTLSWCLGSQLGALSTNNPYHGGLSPRGLTVRIVLNATFTGLADALVSETTPAGAEGARELGAC